MAQMLMAMASASNVTLFAAKLIQVHEHSSQKFTKLRDETAEK